MIPNLDYIKTLISGFWLSVNRKFQDVDDMVSDLESKIPDDYAKENHTHSEYAEKDHTHEEYVAADSPKFTGAISMGRKSGDVIVVGQHSTALGNNVEASGDSSHAEGSATTASGNYSHAEGYFAKASGQASHAEGYDTVASGGSSHAEGGFTIASGSHSHAEGRSTVASATHSHAEGYYTIAAGTYQHAQGSCNIEKDGNYLHVVGNGVTQSDESGNMVAIRSNAHTLDRYGNAWFAGDVYVGSASGKDMDSVSKKLATEEYVDASLILASPNGTRFKITVDDTGTLTATEVT